MLKVEKDGIYRVARMRTGTHEEHGQWQLVAVADDKNEKRTVTIFVDNVPCGAIEGQEIKIKEITSVKIGFKRDHDQQWKPETTMTAIVEPIKSELDDDFGDLDMDAMEGPTPWDAPVDTSGDDWDRLPL
jgi:hypothetical protein